MSPDGLNEVALSVGEINDEIDFSFPPASGQEYIQRVVIEAKKFAEIAVANIDQIQSKSPTAHIDSLSGCMEAPASVYPSIDWQNCQIADFSEIRLRVGQLKNEINETKSSWKSSNIQLPNLNDQKSWIEFCLEYNQEENPKNAPLMKTILRMNQPTVEQILEYLITFVEKQGQMNHRLGQWIYSLLVMLELPLNPDICSCLRTLARACSIIRANSADLKTQEIAALNLFICFVARYFRQLDLADP